MAYNPQQVAVGRIAPFESKTASYLQDLQTARDTRADKEKAEARLALQDQRAARQDERVALQDQLATKERERQEFARKASWDLAPTFTIDAYDDSVRKDRQLLVDAKERELAPALAYLTNNTDTEDAPARLIDTAVNAYKETLKSQGIDTDNDVEKLVNHRRFRLAEFRKSINAAKTPEERQALLDNLTDTLYDNPLNKLDDRISKGIGLTAEQQEQSLFRNIPQEYKDQFSLQELKAILTPQLTGKSEDTIRSAEAARIEAIHKREKDQMEAYDKYYQRVNQSFGEKGYGSNSSWKDISASLKEVGEVNIGLYDTSKVRKGFDHLISKGIPVDIAASTILYGVERGKIDDTFPSIGSKKFAKLQAMAEDMKGMKTSDKNTGKPFLDMNKYVYSDVKPSSVSSILKKELTGDISLRSVVPLNPEAEERVRSLLRQYPAVVNTVQVDPGTPEKTVLDKKESADDKDPIDDKKPADGTTGRLPAPSSTKDYSLRTLSSADKKVEGTVADAFNQMFPKVPNAERIKKAQAAVAQTTQEYENAKTLPATPIGNVHRAKAYGAMTRAKNALNALQQ